jgi:hypothetical protein
MKTQQQQQYSIPMLIATGRDFGPMLLAERKVQVYQRTDGGDGHGKESEQKAMGHGENEPRADTPKRAYNMLIPICLLVFFIFYLLVTTGDDGSGTQSVMDKIENSDSYSALLWGTAAAALLSLMMFWFQFVQDGHFILPTPAVLKVMFLPARCNRKSAEQQELIQEEKEKEQEEYDNMVDDDDVGNAAPTELDTPQC